MVSKLIGIIGVGNPLRKDDGIGILLLDYIREESEHLPEEVSFVDGGTGGMNLLHLFNRFDIIILLDAVNFNGVPGETRFFSFDEIISQKEVSKVSTHNADVFQIIKLSQELNECPDQIFVFGVQPADVSFGDGLTDTIQNKLDDIVTTMKVHVFKALNVKGI
jgi:hydrogenase maturation protease